MEQPGQQTKPAELEAQLPKALRKKMRREEKLRRREQEAAARARKRIAVRAVVVIGVLAVAGGIVWKVISAPSVPNSEVLSTSGIHWHADLSIIIKGQPVEIPANIGLGAVHADMHTHTVNDQIHMEMSRPARQEDVRLGRFFDIWGKQFSSQCIFEYCNGPDGTVRMLVNGEENTEFDNYVMKDGDRIEIRFE